MRTISHRARSWILALLPAVAALTACDRSPTEPMDVPFEAAKGGIGKPSKMERIAFSAKYTGFQGIYSVDPSGGPAKLVSTPPAGFGDDEPTLAPGSIRVAFTRFDVNSGISEIYSATLTGNTLTQVTNFHGRTRHPMFSPDGSKIAFVSDKPHLGATAPINLFVMNADGTNVQLIAPTIFDSRPSWSVDGEKVYFTKDLPINGVPHTWIASVHLPTSTTDYYTGCPNAMCTSPTVDYNSDRIIFEYEDVNTPRQLWMNSNQTNTILQIPLARVGGWNLDGSKFVFVPTGAASSPGMLQILDLASMTYTPLTGARAAFWPTWSR
jgi:Tol biopolymer transport system component